MNPAYLAAAALTAFLQEAAPPEGAARRPLAGFEELAKLRSELPGPGSPPVLLNPDHLRNAMEYPPQALEKEEEGTTHAWLLIGIGGSVERCGTSVSSGSVELDRKTCEIIFATARFRPAQDIHGKPVEALFYQAVTWELEGQDTPSLVASSEELESLEKSLPKPKKHAKLVNSTDVARSMDYPLEALKKGEEGRATAWLLVGTDGRVEKCGIHSSSGSNSLDEQTCNLLIANANFQPAFDRRGRPVQSISYQPIVWKLQEAEWEPGDWATRTSYVIGPNTTIRSCAAEIMAGNAWTEGPEQLCELFLTRNRGALAFARDRTKLHDALVVIESWVLTTPERVMPEVGRGPGEVLIVMRSGSASYDPAGRRVSCTSGQGFGLKGYMDNLCEQDAASGLPVELPKPRGQAITARVLSAIYLKGEPN